MWVFRPLFFNTKKGVSKMHICMLHENPPIPRKPPVCDNHTSHATEPDMSHWKTTKDNAHPIQKKFSQGGYSLQMVFPPHLETL